MPDGSSSAAPVTRPGPSNRNSMMRGFFGRLVSFIRYCAAQPSCRRCGRIVVFIKALLERKFQRREGPAPFVVATMDASAAGSGLMIDHAVDDAEQDAKTHFETGTGMDRVRGLAAIAAEDRADIVAAVFQIVLG